MSNRFVLNVKSEKSSKKVLTFVGVCVTLKTRKIVDCPNNLR